MATTTTKCPICGSENVTPSHLRGFETLIGIVFPRSPYRCKECWSRFWLGSIKGPMFRIVLGLVVLLLAIFFVLPIRQFWHKEEPSSKTVSKAIEKSGKSAHDKIGKEQQSAASVSASEEDDGDEEEDKNAASVKKDIAKSDKPVKPEKTEKEVAGKAVKPSAPSKSDTVAEEEDEEGPEAPQLPKLKEPNVEVPKGGKSPAAKPIAKSPVAKAETKPEKKVGLKEEIDEAEKTEENVVEIPKGTVRKLKSIKANTSDNTVEIVVSADGPVRDYKNFFLLKESPPKLVVDIKGKWKYGGKYAMDVNSDLVSKIRVAEHNEKEFFRIVMDLKVRDGMTPVFNEDAKGLVIIVKK